MRGGGTEKNENTWTGGTRGQKRKGRPGEANTKREAGTPRTKHTQNGENEKNTGDRTNEQADAKENKRTDKKPRK